MRRPMLQVFIHLVWATWDRAPSLGPRARRVAYRTIEDVCQELKCQVLAIGGTIDHVHVLVKLASTVSIADLVKNTKGRSSRNVEEALGNQDLFRRQGSYGAISVSSEAVENVRRYVAGQDEHHRTDELEALYEQTEEYLDPEDTTGTVVG